MTVEDDPALLFEKELGKDELPISDSSEGLSSKAAAYRPKVKPYVLVPTLSESQKKRYKSIEELEAEYDDEEKEIVEIEGEHSIDGKLYCFARHRDGILRRKESHVFETHFPELYQNYKSRKSSGQLSDFDPSSTRIHPAHRVSLKVNIKTRGLNVKKIIEKSREEQRDYWDDSEPLTELSESSEDSEDEDYRLSRPAGTSRTRAGKRASTKTRKLPYSPRKSRKRGVSSYIVESESDSEIAKRRSSRAVGRKNYAINDESDFEDLDSSEAEEELAPARKKARVKKRNGPKPEYGVIRNIDDLYDSDPETASLRNHRGECEKCHRPPAHILLQKPGRKKKRKNEDDSSEDDEEAAMRLGGWVQCLKCCVAAHWRCLASTQRAEIVKAIRARADNGTSDNSSVKIRDPEVDETTEFVCGACSKGGKCMVCKVTVLRAESKSKEEGGQLTINGATKSESVEVDMNVDAQGTSEAMQARELLFRCLKCKRLAHYSHLPMDEEGLPASEIAAFYQEENGWQCADCASYEYPLDKIIAWRLEPGSIDDPYLNNPEEANYRENLPRQYLVKWSGRSFRRVDWVPHMWLVSTSWAKLKNFYEGGPKLQLLDKNAIESPAESGAGAPGFLGVGDASRDASAEPNKFSEESFTGPPRPLPDAEERIPPDWKTVDRILDVLIWRQSANASKEGRGIMQQATNAEADEQDVSAEYEAAFDNGEEPSAESTDTVPEFEARTRRKLSSTNIDLIVWAFIKWKDLPYDEATWDSPPRQGTFGYDDFKNAYDDFLRARTVEIKKKSASEIQKIETRNGKKSWNSESLGIPESGAYSIGQDPANQLMPFQVEGVNWLCRNWFHHQHCILADEMGLGKTVQIISFLGILHARLKIFPALVVVPNSTITNWVREFAKWAPGVRVVPFYGDAKSRDIIKKYELEHFDPAPGTTGAKYHVLITTYETVTGPKEFNAVFKKNPRWEVLVVDEGQRLKSDSNLLFRRLNELKTYHRIIMTGTPLNNNIRELFNLMNFLNPDDWKDLEALSEEFEELDEDRVKVLHERLRPYFLRRVKADVLDLPPKNELILPLSMTPLQKEIYRSILSKNLSALKLLTDSSSSARLNKSVAKVSNLRNMLMQLRKCLQHPYLIADDIEPKGLNPAEAHSKLIDASAKLRFLRTLLPKLRDRGHRVLLFSQFVIALNIIEDFLKGEGYKFLRLDGNSKQAQRQKDMDEFNRADSDVFIFILSTRAGGVGINLWSADTVIIFDPDFNPHQDLQAIARAHRYGQKKTCLVFKLMTKNSAEEKIMQAGKKKLVLDHLIVQKMDDGEEAGNIQSVLTFGAAALFEENGESRDINYSEQDVDQLIDKIETEGESSESEPSTSNVLAFAKVWSAHKDELEELDDGTDGTRQADSWAQTLQKIAEKQELGQIREASGRGVRRKAAQRVKYFEEGSPDKALPETNGKKKRKLDGSDDSGDEYRTPSTRNPSEAPTTGSLDGEDIVGLQFPAGSQLLEPANAKKKVPSALSSGRSQFRLPSREGIEYCGLCGENHGSGSCSMTQNSVNLVEYRKVLIVNEEEPYDSRVEAVHAIDETLAKRGALHLIRDQPKRPILKQRPYNIANFVPSLSSGAFASKLMPHATQALSDETYTSRVPPRVFDSPLPSQSMNMHTNGFTLKPSGNSDNVPTKKAKVRSCEICETSPFHGPTECPEVVKGMRSVTKAIARLSDRGGCQETVSALRAILRKQKRAMQEANLANNPTR